MFHSGQVNFHPRSRPKEGNFTQTQSAGSDSGQGMDEKGGKTCATAKPGCLQMATFFFFYYYLNLAQSQILLFEITGVREGRSGSGWPVQNLQHEDSPASA